MAGLFLRAAYRILDGCTLPLTATEIVERAVSAGYLRSRGKTPTHTMRARLSDEIRRQGSRSDFQRVGPNRFGLRAWGGFNEYVSRPFAKSLPNEVTVCVPASVHTEFGNGVLGYQPISTEFRQYLGNNAHLTYVERATAEQTISTRQLVAYVWLETIDGHILCYTRGKYSSADRSLLLGKKSVGFGGHVLRSDAESLFGQGDAGVRQAAIREVAEELKGFLLHQFDIEGVIWDNSSSDGQKHVGLVLKARIESSSDVIGRSRELSINNLELLSKAELWDSYHNLEFWSQLLVREFAGDYAPANLAKIVPSRRPATIQHIALVGEIASGKSTIAAALGERLGYPAVSASACLADLLNYGGLKEAKRGEFQELALRFIESANGPETLAKSIVDQIALGPTLPHVIDGLRQLSTLQELKRLLPGLIVIYVDCPRDMAFKNYTARWPAATIWDFAAVREHAVEADLPNFRYYSDALLNNADTQQHATDILIRWLGRGR